jgi:hypothetical protein
LYTMTIKVHNACTIKILPGWSGPRGQLPESVVTQEPAI